MGRPGGRGRRRRGDVRLALLLLLSLESPLNGYQLMQGLEERSEGRWRPSPGSVYPALSQLEDEGLIHSVQTGGGESGRGFELTDAGRAHLEELGEVRVPWEAQSEGDDAIAALRHAVGATMRATRQVVTDGNAEQIAKVTELLNETRRAIYRLLAGDADPSKTGDAGPRPSGDAESDR